MMALIAVLALPMLGMRCIDQAREAARESDCRGQLFQYGAALHNYVSANGRLPAASISDRTGVPIHSWRVAYLTSWGEHEINSLYDLRVPWDHPRNSALLAYDTPGFFYWCPSGEGRQTKETSYVAVVGPETAWPGDTGRKFAEITDDPASTILVLETSDSGIHWMEPSDPTLGDLLASGLSSHHESHVNALFADFRVRRVRKDVPSVILRALMTVNGGEKLDSRDWESP